MIVMGDPYHIDNLMVAHASLAAFGETERDNHRQRHHRQLIQSVRDLIKTDPDLAQRIMDEVTGRENIIDLGFVDEEPPARMQTEHSNGNDNDNEDTQDHNSNQNRELNRIVMRAVRERQQRWIVNQRQSAWILTNRSALLKWASVMYNLHKGGSSPKVIAEDVCLMLNMRAVLLGLYFESDLGRYFETTMRWHSSPGRLYQRVGFRIFEIHAFYLDIVFPFWSTSFDNRESTQFKQTWDYLHRPGLFAEKDIAFRKKQVETGIKAGRDELKKMTELLFSAPLIFLLLCTRNGRDFCSALLTFVHERDESLCRSLGLQEEGWGFYTRKADENMSKEQKVWFDYLSRTADESLHWFRQLGLTRPGPVRSDLQKLSKEEDCVRDISTFKESYPNIFSTLECTFGLFPSSSRQAEQGHGFLRGDKGLYQQRSIARTNGRMQMLWNFGYQEREERREQARQRQGVKRANARPDHCKAEQMLAGAQLMKSTERYSDAALQAIPKELLEVRKVKSEGHLVKEKQLGTHKFVAKKKAASKHRKKPRRDSEWIDLAKKENMNNDGKWVPPEKRKRNQLLDSLVKTNKTKTFFLSRLKRDAYIDLLPKVYPKFNWERGDERRACTKLDQELSSHLKEIEQDIDSATRGDQRKLVNREWYRNETGAELLNERYAMLEKVIDYKEAMKRPELNPEAVDEDHIATTQRLLDLQGKDSRLVDDRISNMTKECTISEATIAEY